jgi:hypothetical protein
VEPIIGAAVERLEAAIERRQHSYGGGARSPTPRRLNTPVPGSDFGPVAGADDFGFVDWYADRLLRKNRADRARNESAQLDSQTAQSRVHQAEIGFAGVRRKDQGCRSLVTIRLTICRIGVDDPTLPTWAMQEVGSYLGTPVIMPTSIKALPFGRPAWRAKLRRIGCGTSPFRRNVMNQ